MRYAPTSRVATATARYGHGTISRPLAVHCAASPRRARHHGIPAATLGAPPNSRAYGVAATIAQEDVSAPHAVNRLPSARLRRGQRPRTRLAKYTVTRRAPAAGSASSAPAAAAIRNAGYARAPPPPPP